ncbi:MAG: hypothetical protein LBP33_07505 [Candidatus Adiutrix sp.]|jgi:hypothetical protein|nr:hypothetical protein [Candidatus Adiutrix sp.]
MGMNYDVASVQAQIVAADAGRLYNPGGGDLKRELNKSLWRLCSLHLAACSAKGWDGVGAYNAWEGTLSNLFNQFLGPEIAQAAQSTWTSEVNFIDDMKAIFANNVMFVARGCFLALSLINRTQAIIWLHENGYPLIYEIQGLTRHVFEEAIASGQNGQNSEAASASANRPDQVVAEDESKPAKTEADLKWKQEARIEAEKAAKGGQATARDGTPAEKPKRQKRGALSAIEAAEVSGLKGARTIYRWEANNGKRAPNGYPGRENAIALYSFASQRKVDQAAKREMQGIRTAERTCYNGDE